MSYDPLIQGPRPKEEVKPQASLPPLLDLDNSQPPQDFLSILRNPSVFFASVPTHPSNYLLFKALIGAVTFAMLAQFVRSGFRMDSSFEAIDKILPELFENGSELANNPFAVEMLKHMQTGFKAGLATAGHLFLIMLPIFLVSGLFMKALSLRIFLPLLTDIPKEAVNTRRLFVLLSFPHWLNVFGVIPLTSWLVSLVIFVFSIYAIRWTYKTHWFKTFFAYIFLDLIINLLLVALFLVFMTTLTISGV
jgi:hypothetical protein